MKSLNIKSKTDALEARALAQMGLERKMKAWRGIHAYHASAQTLMSGTTTPVEDKWRYKTKCMRTNCATTGSKNHPACLQRIRLLEKQIREIDQQVEQTLKQAPDLKVKIDQVCTLKGVSILTAVTIISETNGFELIKTKHS
ncbi:MAG: hypothetical protein H6575_07580 [Lewinellaceae bacterium]|nr:hypothetical protein [Lewinellaceae bacterium]